MKWDVHVAFHRVLKWSTQNIQNVSETGKNTGNHNGKNNTGAVKQNCFVGEQ
jgi:hypothetical protein